MSKFKAGDRVECVSSYYNLTVGKCYDIVSISECGLYHRVINDGGVRDGYNQATFKIAAIANGVNAEGQPFHFDISQLKSWMRVTTMKGNDYIVAESNGITFYVREGGWLRDINEAGFEPESVYEPPKNEWDFLNTHACGKLIWKKTPPKTAEQLAQEAAKAAREALIEEAEKALKIAQDTLAALKNI